MKILSMLLKTIGFGLVIFRMASNGVNDLFLGIGVVVLLLSWYLLEASYVLERMKQNNYGVKSESANDGGRKNSGSNIDYICFYHGRKLKVKQNIYHTKGGRYVLTGCILEPCEECGK